MAWWVTPASVYKKWVPTGILLSIVCVAMLSIDGVSLNMYLIILTPWRERHFRCFGYLHVSSMYITKRFDHVETINIALISGELEVNYAAGASASMSWSRRGSI